MRDSRLPDDIRKAVERAPIMFWTCLNHDHKNVTWYGNVAKCDTCGLTSEMTNGWLRTAKEVARAEIGRETATEIEQLRATVARAYAFAEEMRTYCSPHGVAADYANRLEARLKGDADA